LVTDTQVRKLMQELQKHGQMSKAARAAGMSRTTGYRYTEAGKLPSEMKPDRRWRTREDPFAADWEEAVEMLKAAPTLEAKTIFDYLCEKKPDAYHEGQLRTFQRHVHEWRALSGPPKLVFFPQEHRPGEAMQTDFTHLGELKLTVCGEPVREILCHQVLPYSNWEWGTLCLSESLLALRRGMQTALFELGRIPEFHQTDNSTSATHRLDSGKRDFNAEYVNLVEHFKMKLRKTAVGQKEQNGDIEAANGALKRALEQRLLIRGSRDFGSNKELEGWIQEAMRKRNQLRRERIGIEMRKMRQLDVKRLAEYDEIRCRVTKASTITVKKNTYSVPSRLIGEHVQVRISERMIEVRFKGKIQLSCDRLIGEGKARIDYRHIIWTLVRKPDAFARYRHRESMFPSLVFRQAYDDLVKAYGVGRRADLSYLKLLHLSAATMECEIQIALELLQEAGEVPDVDLVKRLVGDDKIDVPDMAPLEADLRIYDELLTAGGMS
jgi:hypothetical protein